MAGFARVVHRQSWEVEAIRDGGVVDTVARGSRQEALDYAITLSPDWIEVGDIADLGKPSQHHVWTTLRRRPDGSYAPSPLRWHGQRKDSG